MNADAPDFLQETGPWRGPITSASAFARPADDGLYEARRLADADPTALVYQSIVSMLQNVCQITADGHRPKSSERRKADPMLHVLRSLASQTDPALLRLTEFVLGYLLEWPVGHQVDDSTARDEDRTDLAAHGEPWLLDVIVPAVHRLHGESGAESRTHHGTGRRGLADGTRHDGG